MKIIYNSLRYLIVISAIFFIIGKIATWVVLLSPESIGLDNMGLAVIIPLMLTGAIMKGSFLVWCVGIITYSLSWGFFFKKKELHFGYFILLFNTLVLLFFFLPCFC